MFEIFTTYFKNSDNSKSNQINITVLKKELSGIKK